MSLRFAVRAARLVAVLPVLVVTACSSESTGDLPALDLIDDAIAAVDEHFGTPSDFYEINATADGVNLFVSAPIDEETAGVLQARYTADEGLVVSDEVLPSEGAVFAGTAVDFDPATIIVDAIEQLSTAQPRVFIITGSPGDSQRTRVAYRLVLESQRGGRLVVFLDRDGTILGSDLLE